ncbi:MULTISPECIES: hypothetical protein [unclassified Mesorhizobium]|uniref:hypothetical protein n=1 Tax=unclassified Mesorhizobium TaxID=325217 RepID=UPI003334C789
MDQKTAIATRKKVLDMVSADGLLVAGMHLRFPGIGHVIREGNAYAYVPLRTASFQHCRPIAELQAATCLVAR